ncbi:MAG: endonuclease III [Vicinamibacterales bacterium]
MKTALDTQRILDALESQHPDADTELDYTTPFELLVATILSAQSTDAGVNVVTPSLFKRYADAASLAAAAPPELEQLIHATGFFRQKARALIGMAKALQEKHGGNVPATMEALVELPGVGRKTANVVLGHALGVPGLPVDRHVLRVSNRIGIAEGDDPVSVEAQIGEKMPRARWTKTSDTLILHGRRICKPQPLCAECAVSQWCDYFQNAASDESRTKPSSTKRPAAARRQASTSKTAAAPARRNVSHARTTARKRR